MQLLQNIRRFSSNIEHKSPGYSEKPDPHLIKRDYIGPPDKESNLRPYVRCIHKNETRLAKVLRFKQLSVEEWNQSFWSRHNKRFYEVSQQLFKLIVIIANEWNLCSLKNSFFLLRIFFIYLFKMRRNIVDCLVITLYMLNQVSFKRFAY